jgi:hypothetical protein
MRHDIEPSRASLVEPGFSEYGGNTGAGGLGLFATCDIPSLTPVIDYLGEVVDAAPESNENSYRLRLPDEDFEVDAKHFGNHSRFVNHAYSDEGANLTVEVFNGQDGHPRIMFLAKHPIKAGCELFFEYFARV